MRTAHTPLRDLNSARLNLRLLATDRGNSGGAVNRGCLLWVTFLGKAGKVTCCRATLSGFDLQPPLLNPLPQGESELLAATMRTFPRYGIIPPSNLLPHPIARFSLDDIRKFH